MDTLHEPFGIPTALQAYTWRPITREDGEALHQLLMDCEAVDQRGWVDTMDERERDFNYPGTDLSLDTLAAFTPEGIMAGFGWIFSPEASDQEILAFPWGEVHPEHRRRGLGLFIMDWSIRRGREILESRVGEKPRYQRIFCPEKLTDRAALYQMHGFHAIRSAYQMRRDLSEPIPDVFLPEGIRLTHWANELDENVWKASNEAFRDHWGFVPVAAEIWKAVYSEHPDFRPDLTWLAIDDGSADGNPVAGLCINKIRVAVNEHKGIQEGWIEDLAVRRAWRKRGVATALLCASMRAFQEAGMDYAGLGVDAENLTGALRLYERLGFSVVQRQLVFQKTVGEGKKSSKRIEAE